MDKLVSDLTCTICNTNIADCVCPERDQELHDIAYDPQASVAFRWCRNCDKHFARCKCEVPQFYAILRGQEMDTTGWKDMLGNPVSLELKQGDNRGN